MYDPGHIDAGLSLLGPQTVKQPSGMTDIFLLDASFTSIDTGHELEFISQQQLSAPKSWLHLGTS
jgi:hypothetical protein